MSTPEAFSEFNTAPSNVGEEPIYGPPTLTQEEIISLLAQTQDEGPEDYTSNFNGQPGNYQFGLGDNMYGNIPASNTEHTANSKIGRYLRHQKGEFINPNI